MCKAQVSHLKVVVFVTGTIVWRLWWCDVVFLGRLTRSLVFLRRLTQFGLPPTTHDQQFGLPATTHDQQFGLPSTTHDQQFGLPSTTNTQFGIPPTTYTQFGLPLTTYTQFGRPSTTHSNYNFPFVCLFLLLLLLLLFNVSQFRVLGYSVIPRLRIFRHSAVPFRHSPIPPFCRIGSPKPTDEAVLEKKSHFVWKTTSSVMEGKNSIWMHEMELSLLQKVQSHLEGIREGQDKIYEKDITSSDNAETKERTK